MHFATEDFVRAEIAERHRHARQERFSHGVRMLLRSRRKADEARLHAERALADHPSGRVAVPVPNAQ